MVIFGSGPPNQKSWLRLYREGGAFRAVPPQIIAFATPKSLLVPPERE